MKYILLLVISLTYFATAHAEVRSNISEDGLSERFVSFERENGFMAAFKSKRRAKKIALRHCRRSGWENCRIESSHAYCSERQVLIMAIKVCEARVVVVGSHGQH